MSEAMMKCCPNCGTGKESAIKRISRGNYRCTACGNSFYHKENISDEALEFIRHADIAKLQQKFEEALELYDNALQVDGELAQAHWGKFLCEFGIIYEKTPSGYIPTCTRVNETSVFQNRSLKNALSCMEDSPELQEDYQQKAKRIEDLRIKVLEKVREKLDFDIFISYKRSDEEKGGFTKDREDARDIYEILITELQIKPEKIFFAEKTLNRLASEDYEPIIFNALNTASLLILVAGSFENLNATWVKNEWARYLRLAEEAEKNGTNQKRVITVCSGEVSPGNLPPKLKKLQALVRTDINFKEDLISNTTRILNKFAKSTIKRKEIAREDVKLQVKNMPTVEIKKRKIEASSLMGGAVIAQNEDTNINLAMNFLRKGNYKSAIKKYENILQDVNPKSYNAHWGLVMAYSQIPGDAFDSNIPIRIDNPLCEQAFDSSMECAPDEDWAMQRINLLIANMNRCKADGYNDLVLLTAEHNKILQWGKDAECELSCIMMFECAEDLSKRGLLGAERMLTESCKTMGQDRVHTYLNRHLKIAENIRLGGGFVDAGRLYQKVLDINEGLSEAIWGAYLCQIKVTEGAMLYQGVTAKTVRPVLERILRNGYQGTKIFEQINDAAIDLFVSNKVKKAQELFECMIELIPEEHTTDLYLPFLLDFADYMMLRGNFKGAEKFYKEVLSKEPNKAEAHYGLFKVKHKAYSDYDIMARKIYFTEDADFNNALNVISDEAETQKYTELCTLHDDDSSYLNNGKRGREKRKLMKDYAARARKELVLASLTDVLNEQYPGGTGKNFEVGVKRARQSGDGMVRTIIVTLLSIAACIIAISIAGGAITNNSLFYLASPLLVIVLVAVVVPPRTVEWLLYKRISRAVVSTIVRGLICFGVCAVVFLWLPNFLSSMEEIGGAAEALELDVFNLARKIAVGILIFLNCAGGINVRGVKNIIRTLGTLVCLVLCILMMTEVGDEIFEGLYEMFDLF